MANSYGRLVLGELETIGNYVAEITLGLPLVYNVGGMVSWGLDTTNLSTE